MPDSAHALPDGLRHVALGDVGSTNDEALTRARAGETGPIWFTATSQSAGRGRRGNAWVSPAGNLYATLLLTDPSAPNVAPQLSFVAALAVHDALADFIDPASIRLKWPNDVLIDGKKIAGLLLESDMAGVLSVAVGIGINCSAHPKGTPYPTTDARAAGGAIAPDTLFPVLARTMQSRLTSWQRGENFLTIRREWLLRAAGLNEIIRVRLPDRELQGQFVGLDPRGRLMLQPDTGPHIKIEAGEVFAFGAARRENA